MELVAPALVNIIAILGIIVGLAFTVWWTVGLFSYHSRAREAELPEVEAPDGIVEKSTGIPAVLTIFMIFTAIVMAAYLLSVWLTGVSY